MPTLIPRSEALSRIRSEGGDPECLMCAIADGKVGALHAVHEDHDVLVFLPRYVRCWGHLCIMPKAHVVSYGGAGIELWSKVSIIGHRVARMVEALDRPRRCYLASTGSSAGELTQSSRHLHLHVIPVHDPEDRPASVFSWQEGVYVAEHDEWIALRDECRRWWSAHA